MNTQNKVNPEDLQNVLTETKLNWTVKKVPLFAEDNGVKIDSNYCGILRSDNNEVLSTCKESYQPVQNLETVELLHEIANKSGLEIVSGGPIQGGKKVFIQMKDVNGDIQILNDSVERYIFAINSHDSSTSLAFGTSNRVKSCDNQFFQFYKQAQLKFRHTKSYKDKINEALKLIDLGKRTNENDMYKTFKQWSETEIGNHDVRNLILSIEDYDIQMGEDELKNLYSTRKINQMTSLVGAIESEIASKGNTVWGLFNGITYYTNHIDGHCKRENGKVEKLIIGSGYKQNNKAYSSLQHQFA